MENTAGKNSSSQTIETQKEKSKACAMEQITHRGMKIITADFSPEII